MGSKSVGRRRTPRPTFGRRGDFSPSRLSLQGSFMSEMHEATPVSQPFPHFERFLDSREAAALLQIHPKTLLTASPQGRDTRHADRKIVAHTTETKRLPMSSSTMTSAVQVLAFDIEVSPAATPAHSPHGGE